MMIVLSEPESHEDFSSPPSESEKNNSTSYRTKERSKVRYFDSREDSGRQICTLTTKKYKWTAHYCL